MLGEVGYEPLDSTPARLNVSELALVRRGAGKVCTLLFNDAATQFLGSGQLKATPRQHLQLVNATPEGLGCQSAKARFPDGLEVLAVGLLVERHPVAASGQARAGAAQVGLRLQRCGCVVGGERQAVDEQLSARGAERNGRRLLHLRHGELALLGKRFPHDSHVSSRRAKPATANAGGGAERRVWVWLLPHVHFAQERVCEGESCCCHNYLVICTPP